MSINRNISVSLCQLVCISGDCQLECQLKSQLVIISVSISVGQYQLRLSVPQYQSVQYQLFVSVVQDMNQSGSQSVSGLGHDGNRAERPGQVR